MKRLTLTLLILLALTACAQVDTTPTTSPPPVTQVQTTDDATAVEPTDADPYASRRDLMVEETIVSRGVEDDDVLRALREVPRHQFVPEDYQDQAYEDHPLPIGFGQTISQPFIVAWMTELLELEPGDKVLEIGTGSGYQAAVLAELGTVEVYSIEIIPELAERAANDLQQAGYTDVVTMHGDGYFGWEEHAPFDAIIVTAAPDHLPPPLTEQLAPGGVIVIPIGPPGGYQTLWQFRVEDGELVSYNLGAVSFVPFTREE
jgi:protein-L-isoaspartate(D-aspartate) O-methyltransferase